MPTAPLFPLFVKLAGRHVTVVGGGAMAEARVRSLAQAGARITVVAPEVRPAIVPRAAQVRRRAFRPDDLDGAWLAVAAATPEVNRAVAAAADVRRVLVNAVDDPDRASAYAGGVVRRGDVTVAISTGGRAPALAGLLREAIDAVLPRELDAWLDAAEMARAGWKRERVPMATRRPLLLRTLNALYGDDARAAGALGPALAPAAGKSGGAGDRSLEAALHAGARRREPAREGAPFSPGSVALVGAGPGDPGFLTRRGAERLAQADVVLYDALVDPAALRLAPRAHCFQVGKRAGGPSASQRAIERIMIRAARRGRRVVRLKCGDPFVLGRGGEEASALAAAGVPFEVVPGVTSAVAAPALAGIPVTHRGLASAFAVVSGHREASYGPVLDGIAPGSVTLVVLMGIAKRARIAARLAARGWDPATPAALVLGASSAAARTWTGALGDLAEAPLPGEAAALPGTLVVGAVAALARNRQRSPAREHGARAAARA